MTWKADIKIHYEEIWKVGSEICEFRTGPVHELPSDFMVLRYPPHGKRQMWTYATSCMSLPGDKKPIELHMFSARPTNEIVELLFATAHFHRNSAKLDVGHSVNFGRSWIDRSECRHGVISMPYLDGPNLEILSVGSNKISFYWLIPVTEAEVAYKMRRGLDALEIEFDNSKFNYVDSHRKSVV